MAINSMFGGEESGVELSYAQFNAKTAQFCAVDKETKEKRYGNRVVNVMLHKITLGEDQYEGTKFPVLQIQVKNAEGVVQVSFKAYTLPCAKMVSAMLDLDMSKPFSFASRLYQKGETIKGKVEPLKKDWVSLGIFQEGSPHGYLQPSEDIPKGKEVVVGSKTIFDNSEREAYTIRVIKELIERSRNLEGPPLDDQE
jgi:hypothetical protein